MGAQHHCPLDWAVTRRFRLDQADAAIMTFVADGAMKVFIGAA
jgi:hypothetical protein